MDLQPAEALEQFAVRNRPALSLVHRDLLDVVPAVFAMLEPAHPDGRIHGGVFAALVRDLHLVSLQKSSMRAATLVAEERPFRSVRFKDGEDWRCRVHMHPKAPRTGRFLDTTPAPEPLFGERLPPDGYDLAVLWRPSVKSKGLRSALLAAVSDLDDRNLTTIFASAPLPPVESETYWRPDVSEDVHEPVDDFDDFLSGEEGAGSELPS